MRCTLAISSSSPSSVQPSRLVHQMGEEWSQENEGAQTRPIQLGQRLEPHARDPHQIGERYQGQGLLVRVRSRQEQRTIIERGELRSADRPTHIERGRNPARHGVRRLPGGLGGLQLQEVLGTER